MSFLCAFFPLPILTTCPNWAVIYNLIWTAHSSQALLFLWSQENTSVCKNRQSILGLQYMTSYGKQNWPCWAWLQHCNYTNLVAWVNKNCSIHCQAAIFVSQTLKTTKSWKKKWKHTWDIFLYHSVISSFPTGFTCVYLGLESSATTIKKDLL